MPNNNAIATGKLEKAKLISDESDTIEFMFNPNELSFEHSITLREEEGSRTEKGLSKVSFAYPNPSKITIGNILFDTYEEQSNVLVYIDKFRKALDFAEKGSAKGKRPPVYTFVWGNNKYLRCFIDSLTYKLTRFLPDGTPVQAKIDSLTLKEVDESFSQANSGKSYTVNRTGNGR